MTKTARSPKTPGGYSTRTRSPAWRLGAGAEAIIPAPPPVELREGALSPVTVAISSLAADVITDEIERCWADLLEGVEAAGGLLLGSVSVDEIEVTRATTFGPGAERRVGSVTFSLADGLRGGDPSEVVGGWHVHATLATYPSRADLDSWPLYLDGLGLRSYVGLLVTSADGTWMRLDHEDVHPWVARRDGGRVVVEPAQLKGGS
jgi:hypothetical protein